jgi:hypothetical protein
MTMTSQPSIPDKFKDPQTGELKLESLLTSYSELEKRLSKSPSIPKTPDEYCIDCSKHGLFDIDAELNARLHAKGFTNDQVQEVYDLAAEKMVPLIIQMAADYRADREIEKLDAHFGGADKWHEMARQILAYGQKNLPADVLDALASSYEGVLSLHRMMKGVEPGLTRNSEGAGDKQSLLDLQSMMRDPKYWRDQDPSFVSKVTEGFQKIYAGK